MADPRTVRNISLRIGGEEYAAHANDVNITPPAPVTWQGGTDSATYSDTPSGGHILNIAGVQNYEDAESLSSLLLDNAGEKVLVLFSPNRATGGAWFSTEATLVAPAIGGPVGQFAPFQVACPATKPKRAAAPAAAS
ncbi:hypothetical protein [Rathayibacter sp. AY1A7]|uniref:hypothetical protein n=1 Tax=Rathayibacter sp. AY1A7 TaxID=2080524 RepID=UPI000CE761D2|nr:hypothetical protein [Rathayibacter sp. AY1A7]PPF21030.1 hypothetical protein C5B95_06365 [Rathayibacter sp. AY1A7]